MNRKDKRQMTVPDFPPPCKGWVRGVECVLGPRHSCVESERASRGSPLSLQLKGLAVIGTKALSSRFFSLLASLFSAGRTPQPLQCRRLICSDESNLFC